MTNRLKLRAATRSLVVAGALAAFAPALAQDAAQPAPEAQTPPASAAPGAAPDTAPAPAPEAPAAEAPAAEAPAGEPDEVLARVGGKEITVGDVALAEEDLGNALTALPPEQRRDYLLSYLIDLTLLAQAGERDGMAEGADFQARLDYLRDKALMMAFLEQATDEIVTEEAVQGFYQQQVSSVEGEEEVSARHILVETEEEAQAIVEELEGGADFATLAAERTTEEAGRERGGDLGYFTRERMVPAFAEAAFALEEGAISAPVETQFGWHVIKVEDKRPVELAALEQVEGQLREYLEQQAQTEIITQLRAAGDVERIGAEPAEPVEGEAPAAEGEAPAGGEPAPAPGEAPAEAEPAPDAAAPDAAAPDAAPMPAPPADPAAPAAPAP